MYNALHPRNDIDRLYMSIKEGGRTLVEINENKKIKNKIK